MKPHLQTILIAAIIATSDKASIRRPRLERSPDALLGSGLLARMRSGAAAL